MFKKNEIALVYLPDNEFWHGAIVKLIRAFTSQEDLIYVVEAVVPNGYISRLSGVRVYYGQVITLLPTDLRKITETN